MLKDNTLPNRPIKSFVIRSGRMTPAQEQAYQSHWTQFGLSTDMGQTDLSGLFSNTNPVVLEIGFGMGDSLFEMAQSTPEMNFIGVEVHKPGVGRLLNLAQQAGLENLRVFHHDAIDVLNSVIPDQSLSRVQIYFPDPWHKKKHHKRRIIQPEFLNLMQEKLMPRGVLHLATDWEPYAESMLALLSSSALFDNLSQTGYSERPKYRPKTKFEKRGERLGHGVWDLLFMTKPLS